MTTKCLASYQLKQELMVCQGHPAGKQESQGDPSLKGVLEWHIPHPDTRLLKEFKVDISNTFHRL